MLTEHKEIYSQNELYVKTFYMKHWSTQIRQNKMQYVNMYKRQTAPTQIN